MGVISYNLYSTTMYRQLPLNINHETNVAIAAKKGCGIDARHISVYEHECNRNSKLSLTLRTVCPIEPL